MGRYPTCPQLPFQGSRVSVLSMTVCGRACDPHLQARNLRFGMVKCATQNHQLIADLIFEASFLWF